MGRYSQPPPLDSILCARADLVRKNLMGYPISPPLTYIDGNYIIPPFFYVGAGYPKNKKEELKNNYDLRNLFVEGQKRQFFLGLSKNGIYLLNQQQLPPNHLASCQYSLVVVGAFQPPIEMALTDRSI